MTLDILERMLKTRRAALPILLIRGAWHGNWFWIDNFLPYLAEQEFAVKAVSLHGLAN